MTRKRNSSSSAAAAKSEDKSNAPAQTTAPDEALTPPETAPDTPPAATEDAAQLAIDPTPDEIESAPDHDPAPVEGSMDDIKDAVESEGEEVASPTPTDDPGREIPPHRSGGGAAPAEAETPEEDVAGAPRTASDILEGRPGYHGSDTAAAALNTGQTDIEDLTEAMQSPGNPLRPYNKAKSLRRNAEDLSLIAQACADIHGLLSGMVGLPGELTVLMEACGPASDEIRKRLQALNKR